MAKLSNENTTLKTEQVNSKNISGSNVNVNQLNTEWEFFKKNNGIVTDYLNKQINIPSTAFTPNMVLPSKTIFTNIMAGYSVLSSLSNIMKKLSGTLQAESSFSFKSKEVVKKSVASAFGGK